MSNPSKYSKKILVSGLCILFQIQIVLAQHHVIRGVVNDASDNTPIFNCIVFLKSAPDSATVSYTTTTIDGVWQFEIEVENQQYLEFRILGYKGYIHPILKNDLNKRLVINLKQDNNELSDVTITAKRLGIQQKGDTIDYDLKSFTTGDEETLGEVIEKLPGMDISHEGEIQYNGSRVDVLLVEAKDILNNQHKLAAEGLRSEDIEDIQIIENYKSPSDLSRKESQKTAMNIELTNEAKAKWRGSITGKAGYPKAIDSDVSIFNINDTWSTTVFMRFNSVGKALLSISDYLSMQVSMLSTLKNNRNSLDNILPENFLLPIDLTMNKDALIAANIHKEKDNNLASKLSIHAMNLNRQRELAFIRNYRTNNEIFGGNKNVDIDIKTLNLHYNDSWNLPKNGTFTFDLPFNISKNGVNDIIEGNVNDTQINAFNQRSNTKLSVKPSAKYNQKISEQWLFSLYSDVDIYASQKDISISDVTDLLGTNDNYITQDISQSFYDVNVGSTIEFSNSRHSGALQIYRAYQYDKINTLSSQEQFIVPNTKSRSNSWATKIFYRWENTKWIFEPSFDLYHTKRTFEQLSSAEYTHNFDLLIKYSFKKLHFILLNYTNASELIGFNQYSNALLIEDPVTLSLSGLNYNQTVLGEKINLSYFKYSLSTGTRFHTLFNYINNTNEPFHHATILGKTILEQWQTNERSQSWSLRSTLYQPVFTNNGAFQGSFLWNHSNNQLNANDRFLVTSINASLSYETRLKRSPFNSSIGYTFLSQSSDQGLVSTSLHRHSIPTKTILNLNNFNIRIESTFTTTNINTNQSINYWMIGTEIKYKLNDKFELVINGVDLSNLNGVRDASTEFNPVYQQINQFIRFPGYIIMGVNVTL